jgi:SAM-dependent methyltransferase
MRAMADAEADRRLADPDRARFSSMVAFADSLPVGDRAFDVAVSSFVFQLVPNRSRALREARRVLRPGGLLAYVSWLDGDPVGAFLPDAIFDEVLDELEFGPPDGDDRTGDIPSVERAAGELRRAGFADVTARAGILAHPFTVDGYLGFLTEFDEESMFAELDPALRDRVITTLRDRLAPLTSDQLTMRARIVFASGRRSS